MKHPSVRPYSLDNFVIQMPSPVEDSSMFTNNEDALLNEFKAVDVNF